MYCVDRYLVSSKDFKSSFLLTLRSFGLLLSPASGTTNFWSWSDLFKVSEKRVQRIAYIHLSMIREDGQNLTFLWT